MKKYKLNVAHEYGTDKGIKVKWQYKGKVEEQDWNELYELCKRRRLNFVGIRVTDIDTKTVVFEKTE